MWKDVIVVTNCLSVVNEYCKSIQQNPSWIAVGEGYLSPYAVKL